jgi:HD superfamily phosphohydrolase
MLSDIETKAGISHEIVKDPLYGYIALYEHEKDIIDTPSFQRLRRIKQLPSAHYVYPGATHTRFSHSLGVMHLSGLFLKNLLEPHRKYIDDDEFLRYYFLVRLWGLTHDLGHGPFSHTFDKVVLEEFGMNHEYMSSRIVQKDNEIASVFDKKLKDYNITPKDLAEYLGKSREEWPETKKLGKTEHSEAAFYYILKGFYSTDIIDYLIRDNHFTGAGYGNFDWQRLILSSHLQKDEVALEKKSRDALDAFLLSRLFSFDTIYYHRWSRVIDYIMKNFLVKAKKKLDFQNLAKDIKEYGKLDEESIFHMNELKGIPELGMLRNRIIPFRQISEKKVRLDKSTFAFLDEDDLSSLLVEKLKSKIPRKAFFVDTPKLAFCPMVEEEEVCIVDMSSSPPHISRERVRETSIGEVPYSVWTIRLYLDVKYKQKKDELRKAFEAMISKETKLKTHY